MGWVVFVDDVISSHRKQDGLLLLLFCSGGGYCVLNFLALCLSVRLCNVQTTLHAGVCIIQVVCVPSGYM